MAILVSSLLFSQKYPCKIVSMHSKNDSSSPTKRKIYYWNGLFDPRGLAEKYGHIIDQLASGDYALMDLEKTGWA